MQCIRGFRMRAYSNNVTSQFDVISLALLYGSIAGFKSTSNLGNAILDSVNPFRALLPHTPADAHTTLLSSATEIEWWFDSCAKPAWIDSNLLFEKEKPNTFVCYSKLVYLKKRVSGNLNLEDLQSELRSLF
ncbi:hypothetical protein CDAR_303011 [Caerostris darwini]|uniref:Uncharacterized protein n=1 Tax=Caerostris darwini TaxID=1538125 RepID=A0AAV4V4U9_9ARAC|nr:hypothetical protein CDAR_303011 [Caerostris darwini]